LLYCGVSDRSEVLREVMLETGITQSELSRISGVRQPSISQFLSGRVEMSDDMLDRLLSCMGFRLEVVRRPVRRELSRSYERSWLLHRRLSTHLTPETLDECVRRSCATSSGFAAAFRVSRTSGTWGVGSNSSVTAMCPGCVM